MMKIKRKSLGQVYGSLFEKNPKVFELQLFSSNYLENLVIKRKITGTPAETVDINSVVHRSLATYSYLRIVAEESFTF